VSLKFFHVVFVSMSSLLAFSFGGWNLHSWTASAGTASLITAVGSFVAGVGLIAYGFWFWKKITTRDEEERRRRNVIKGLAVMAGVWLLASQDASACTVCYGEAEGPMVSAARLGVYLLFGLTFLIQGAFASFFIYLWRRARKHRPPGAEFDWQQP
jgi:hypothetical protein